MVANLYYYLSWKSYPENQMIARNIEYDGWIKFERKEKIARWKFELNVWTVGKKWSMIMHDTADITP